MKDLFRISEVASIFGISKQSLQFYDKKGIFTPDNRNEENGYREYSVIQLYELSLITYLKKLGFSLDKIKKYKNKSDVSDTMKNLKDHASFLKEQCAQLTRLSDTIQRRVIYTDEKLKDIQLRKPTIKRMSRCYYLDLGKKKTIFNNEFFYRYPTIAFYDYEKEHEDDYLSFGAYITDLDKCDKEFIMQLDVIEAQNYLCFYYEGDYTYIPEQVAKIMKEYAYLGLENKSVNYNILDWFLVNDSKNYLTRIQIPIKS